MNVIYVVCISYIAASRSLNCDFSGNLEMSGNLANIEEKAHSQGKVREFALSGKFDCGSPTK